MSCSFPPNALLSLHNICLSISEYVGGEEGLIAVVISADQEASSSQSCAVCSWLVFLRVVLERLVTESFMQENGCTGRDSCLLIPLLDSSGHLFGIFRKHVQFK